MVIVGDIAVPTPVLSSQLKDIFREHKGIFGISSLVCNLEGLVSDDTPLSSREPVLFNHSSVLEALKEGNIRAVGLANNHIFDLPEHFPTTRQMLIEQDISFTGLSESAISQGEPAEFFEDGKRVVLFNYCWNFLLYHQNNSVEGLHINVLEEQVIIDSVSEYRYRYSDAIIAVYLHWSFDLEVLPFPMYRQFSRSLIDNGANLVIGAHSHCVQGGEKYNNGFIIYGLGNFFIPYNTFAGSYLTFPDFARLQLAFEFNVETNAGTCHWFEYQNEGDNHTLKHLASERFEESKLLKKFSPFSGMNDSEYYHYFKKNRRKKFLIPIFKDYRHKRLNAVLILWLKMRARFARILATYKIIGWQR